MHGPAASATTVRMSSFPRPPPSLGACVAICAWARARCRLSASTSRPPATVAGRPQLLFVRVLTTPPGSHYRFSLSLSLGAVRKVEARATKIP